MILFIFQSRSRPAAMSTNDQPSNVGNNGTMMRGTGWMYEGANNSINKEVGLLLIISPFLLL